MTVPTPPVPAPPNPAPTPEPPAPAPTPPASFTQDDLNRIATREKAEGERAAAARFAQDLGVSLEDAKRIIAEAKTREDSQKSEAQRETEAAATARSEADKEKAAAAKERHEARLDRAFVVAGITDEAKIAKFSRLLDVELGASPEDVKKAIESLKTDMPELFGAADPDPTKRVPPKAPNSDPKATPPAPKQSEDAFQRGMELAAMRGNRGNPYPAQK